MEVSNQSPRLKLHRVGLPHRSGNSRFNLSPLPHQIPHQFSDRSASLWPQWSGQHFWVGAAKVLPNILKRSNATSTCCRWTISRLNGRSTCGFDKVSRERQAVVGIRVHRDKESMKEVEAALLLRSSKTSPHSALIHREVLIFTRSNGEALKAYMKQAEKLRRKISRERSQSDSGHEAPIRIS